MTDQEIIYRLVRILCETDAAMENKEQNYENNDTKQLAEEIERDLRIEAEELAKRLGSANDTICKLSDDNSSLMFEVKEKNERIAALEEQLEGANLQVATLERRLAEAEALCSEAPKPSDSEALPEPSEPPYGLLPVERKEERKEVKKEGMRKHSLECFLEYPNGDCPKFQSISKACRFLAELPGVTSSADSIHTFFNDARKKGKPEVFHGYKLIRTGGGGDGQE